MTAKDSLIRLEDVAIVGGSDSDEPELLLLDGSSPRAALAADYSVQLQHGPCRRGVPGLQWVGRIVRRRRRHSSRNHHQPRGSDFASCCLAPHQLVIPGAAAAAEEEEEEEEEQSREKQSVRQPGLLHRLLRAVLRPVVAAVKTAYRHSQPQGPGDNDNSLLERVLNVVTCAPFLAVGLQGLRRRTDPQARYAAASFLVVGVVASAYHAAFGAVRPLMRKMDYWTICHASGALRRAAGIPLPLPAAVACAALVPIKPTLVNGINMVLVEAKYFGTAVIHKQLLGGWCAHAATALAALTCFSLEDCAIARRWPPLFHSMWHCLSALAMGMSHSLLQHLEATQAIAVQALVTA